MLNLHHALPARSWCMPHICKSVMCRVSFFAKWELMDTCPHIQLGHITPYSCDGKISWERWERETEWVVVYLLLCKCKSLSPLMALIISSHHSSLLALTMLASLVHICGNHAYTNWLWHGFDDPQYYLGSLSLEEINRNR